MYETNLSRIAAIVQSAEPFECLVHLRFPYMIAKDAIHSITVQNLHIYESSDSTSTGEQKLVSTHHMAKARVTWGWSKPKRCHWSSTPVPYPGIKIHPTPGGRESNKRPKHQRIVKTTWGAETTMAKSQIFLWWYSIDRKSLMIKPDSRSLDLYWSVLIHVLDSYDSKAPNGYWGHLSLGSTFLIQVSANVHL